MKIFYDKDGNITGTLEGASLAWEQEIKHPVYKEVTISKELEEKIKDPEDPLTAYSLKVKNKKVIDPTI